MFGSPVAPASGGGMFGSPASGGGLFGSPKPAAAPLAAGMTVHTWERSGSLSLGLVLTQRGSDRTAPHGVQVKDATNPELAHLVGLVLESIAGTDVSKCSYEEVLQKVKAAARPLRVIFSACEGAPAEAAAVADPEALFGGGLFESKTKPAVEDGGFGSSPHACFLCGGFACDCEAEESSTVSSDPEAGSLLGASLKVAPSEGGGLVGPSPEAAAALPAVDDVADKARLTALYSSLDVKMPKIDSILAKRSTQADRDKLWQALEKQYPAFFQN